MRWMLIGALAVSVAGCAGLGFTPSQGTGAADLNASEGFGLGASNEASPLNQATPGPGVFEFGGGN